MFNKDSVRNIDLIAKSSEPVVPNNQTFYDWFKKQNEGIFSKAFDIFDAENPEIENAFSSIICNKAVTSSGIEAEAIAASLEVVNRPRFFRHKDMRDKARKYKSACTVGMRGIYVLGENGYCSFPENINPLMRHSKYEEKDYNKYKNFAKVFSDVGLVEIKAVINRIINRMGDFDKSNSWLGFHRTKPDEVAATLARMHNLEWSDVFNLSCPLNRLPEFIVKIDPEEEKSANETNALAEVLFVKSAKKIKKDFKFINLGYEPRMYPVHEFNVIPEKAESIIASVEKMPELGGRPGFDYLWVLVPGFSLKHPSIHHQDGVFRIMMDGKVLESKSEIEVASKLDKELIRQNIIMPCILGERDGKCYFVGPWI